RIKRATSTIVYVKAVCALGWGSVIRPFWSACAMRPCADGHALRVKKDAGTRPASQFPQWTGRLRGLGPLAQRGQAVVLGARVHGLLRLGDVLGDVLRP